MLCCIDVGNTNIVIGISVNRNWIAKWRIQTVKEKMPDEYAVLFKTLLAEKNISISDINKVIISTVVPQLKPTFNELFKRYRGVNPIFLGPGIKSGIKIRTDNPKEVGADLVADAVAAYNRYQSGCIVVDFGTATTFSAISSEAELLGVAIAPGLEVSANALSLKAAQLPMIDLIAPKNCIGTNTIDSLRSGIIYGYVGLVEGLVRRIKEVVGSEASVIATGGLSRIIVPLTNCIDEVDMELTLEGLKIIAEKN